ncbi:MAG: glycine cleavage system protein GcvH [Bacteroidales bacterium]|nr:glycine cleavage system protein GcvH [Bacteroidales bacterium]
MSKVLEGIRYSESHEWVKAEGNIAYIGVSDFAQSELGDITYVDVPGEGEIVTKGVEFGALESVKTAADLVSPVSGKIIEANGSVIDAPELINQDAYSAWIVKVEMSDPSEIDTLLTPEEYGNIAK